MCEQSLMTRFHSCSRVFLVAILIVTCLFPDYQSAKAGPDESQMRASTVWVLSGNERGGYSGSGFIVGDGSYIVTNWHVVSNTLQGAKVTVVLGKNNVRRAKVLRYSKQKDIAILQLNENSGRPPVKFATKGNVKVGDSVYVMGFPGPVVSADQMKNITAIDETVTRGIISRKIRLSNGVNYYQTDAAINPGNSGGPMFSENGAIIGIVAMRLERKGNRKLENVGFAIMVDELLPELEAAGIRNQTQSGGNTHTNSEALTQDQNSFGYEEDQDNMTKNINKFLYPGLAFLAGAVGSFGAWTIWRRQH